MHIAEVAEANKSYHVDCSIRAVTVILEYLEHTLAHSWRGSIPFSKLGVSFRCHCNALEDTR